MSELRALLTADGLRVLDALPPIVSSDDVLRAVTRLRAEGHDPELVSAAVGQARLRTRAEAKFGDMARGMLFTRAGLEQSTRLAVGVHHAARLRSAGIARVADLGCGIGGDALAFAGAGIRVLAVDADDVTAAIAAYNLAPFGDDVRVVHQRAEQVDLDGTIDDGAVGKGAVDAVWLDPARRTSGHAETRRLADPADWSPPLDWVFSLARRLPAGIKLGPGFPREQIPHDLEAQWISVDGSTVELVLWSGSLARPSVRRAALVLRSGSGTGSGSRSASAHELTAADDAADAPVRPLGAFVHEPDGAVIRSRLIGTVARDLGAGMLADGIAYITGDDAVTSPFVSSFRVRETLPFDERKLSRALRERGIGTLEIKKRGIDLDPARLRPRLRLAGDESATLLLTRVDGAPLAILADRVA